MARGQSSIIEMYSKPMRPPPPPRPQEPCPDCPDPSQDGNIQGALQAVLNMKQPDGSVRPVVAQNGGIPIQSMTNSAWPIYVQVVGAVTTGLTAGAVYNSNVNASAAIDGTKINPDFGAQYVVTTSNIGASNITTTTGATVIKVNAQQLRDTNAQTLLDWSDTSLNFIGNDTTSPVTNAGTVSTSGYYGNSSTPLLAEPAGWLKVKIDGNLRKMPYYNP